MAIASLEQQVIFKKAADVLFLKHSQIQCRVMYCFASCFILAFSFTRLMVSAAENTYGINEKIIDGIGMDIAKVPYQVGIETNGVTVCGGSIIGPKYILTAAHCVERSSLDCDNINIRTGSSLSGIGGTTVTVKKFEIHPKYLNFKNIFFDYDVAVLELVRPIIFNNKSKSIPLACSPPLNGDVIQLTGWGRITRDSVCPSKTLQSAYMVALNIDFCEDILYKSISNQTTCAITCFKRKILTPRQICLKDINHGMACNGDSGGPAVLKGVQVGVNSWGWIDERKGRQKDCSIVNGIANVADPEIRDFIRSKTGI